VAEVQNLKMTTHLKTLIALAGMFVGVVISETTTYGTEVAVFALVLGIVQMSIYFLERRKSRKGVIEDGEKINNMVLHFSIPLASGIFFIFVALLIIRIQFGVEKHNFVCEKVCEFTATLISSPSVKNEYQIFSVRPDSKDDTYDVQVKVPLYPQFEVGERVRLVGRVSLPHTFLPHDRGKVFDYEMYLRTHEVGSEMFFPKVIVLASGTNEYSLRTKLQHLREYFVRGISFYVSQPEASLVAGMLFGVTSMSEELTQTFRVAGISHIVVLSGFNIAILISFVLLIFVFLPLFVRIVCAGIFVLFFVLMVGGEASIVRATIMSFIGLAALLIGRAYVARQALILSLIIIVLYEPVNLLHNVSLHLSFLATAGIVYMSDGVKIMLEKVRSKTYQEIIATTLSAYLATLPYVMYTFGKVSLYALFANFIVLPFVPFVMLLTFLIVVTSLLSQGFALIIGYVDTLIAGGIISVARITERLPFASVEVSFSFTTMCIGYCILVCGYNFLLSHYTRRATNETLLTKQDEILSEVISY
jgi:competence protein ComEC